jgi:phosphotransferase system HPr-like phosphotransfer protein
VAAFQSTITIASNGKSYRADRIMEVLLADLNCGDTFMIEALVPTQSRRSRESRNSSPP